MNSENGSPSSASGGLSEKDFRELCEIIYEKSGIALKPGKESLVSSRVGRRLRFLNLDSFKEYLSFLRSDDTGDEIVQLLDAITTNVTSFFREAGAFTFFEEYVQNALKRRQTRFRAWSAACSSGEEPYTMAMIMAETCGMKADWKILATDISTKILEKAQKGIFSEEQMEKVPSHLRQKYFQANQRGKDPTFSIIPELREKVLFRRLNLAQPPFPMKGPLDMVFCRNVMIYFDDKVKTALLIEILRLLAPGGYLCVGASESLSGIAAPMNYILPSIYQKVL